MPDTHSILYHQQNNNNVDNNSNNHQCKLQRALKNHCSHILPHRDIVGPWVMVIVGPWVMVIAGLGVMGIVSPGLWVW